MAENNETMAVISDEEVFSDMGGRYSSSTPNIDLFLQGHSGSPVRVDRGSRPPVHLEAPCLTLGLTVQPEVLRAMAEKPAFRGRGLLARILYFVPSSLVGYRDLFTRPVPKEVEQIYNAKVTALPGPCPVQRRERQPRSTCTDVGAGGRQRAA